MLLGKRFLQNRLTHVKKSGGKIKIKTKKIVSKNGGSIDLRKMHVFTFITHFYTQDDENKNARLINLIFKS